jgi:hypothetical protein
VSKSTVGLRAADGSTSQHVVESLPGGKHMVDHVATSIPTVVSCQQVTAPTTAGSLASICSGSALPTGATHALVRAETGNTAAIRWWDDGTSPTTSAGMELAAGDMVELVNLASVKLIATGTQKLNISFRKYDA